MTKREQLSASEMAAEPSNLDLQIAAETRKRSDDLRRTLLSSPPDISAPKPKAAKKLKRSGRPLDEPKV